MKSWIGLAIILLVSMLSGCQRQASTETETVPKVKVTTVGSQDTSDNLFFPAVATAANRAHLSFRVAGEISQLKVKEGDRVTQGEVIAILEPTDYQLEVDNAKAKYTVIDSQYKRSKSLVETGLLAKSQFDEIAANRQIADAELQLAKLRLSFTELKAPVDGIISRVAVDQYENIQVGQQIVNIHSTDSVEVVIQLPDRLYTRPPEQENFAKIDAIVRVPSGQEYLAQVKEFTTEPDPSTGTFTVTLSMPMPEQEYVLDGMAVEVTTKGEQRGANLANLVQVPIESIFNGDGDPIDRDEKYIWLLNPDNTVTKQRVVTGKATKRAVQIVEGLEAGQQVVIAGLSRLKQGMKVTQVAEEAAHD